MVVDFIYRGKAIIGDEIREATIVIDRGLIIGVHGPAYSIQSDVVLDYSGRNGVVALPGAIDIHVHLRGLELSYKEDEYTGTRAAARGGFTVVIDMPNTKPYINTKEALLRKLHELERKSIVDYGLYIGVPNTLDAMEELMVFTKNIIGLKIYPHDLKKSFLSKILRHAAKKNLVIVVHAEDPDYLREVDKPGYRWLGRTVESEMHAIMRIGAMARWYNARIHITHITSSYGLRTAKQYGFTVDATPHHLLLDSSYEEKFGAIAKVNPPLRPGPVCEMLLEDLRHGLIDAIATDHAPHSIKEKSAGFAQAPPGIVGLETAIPLILTLSWKGFISLVDVAKLISGNPARILGLSRLGSIKEGYVGNLTIVDVDAEYIIRPDEFESKAKFSPFEGFACRGRPIATIVRGEIIYLNGVFHGDRGYGVNVKEYSLHLGKYD